MNHLHQIELGFAICGLAGCVFSFALGIIAGIKIRMDMEARESEHHNSSVVRDMGMKNRPGQEQAEAEIRCSRPR